MTRILIGALAALVVALSLIGWRAHELTKSLAQAEQDNAQLQATIADSIAERAILDKVAADAIRRRNQEAQAKDAALAELKRLRRDNAELRTYLDSAIPGPVAGWMWMPACNQGGQAIAPGSADGANAQACHAVSHQEGWTWCKEVELALDSCNADKASLREWARSQ